MLTHTQSLYRGSVTTHALHTSDILGAALKSDICVLIKVRKEAASFRSAREYSNVTGKLRKWQDKVVIAQSRAARSNAACIACRLRLTWREGSSNLITKGQ